MDADARRVRRAHWTHVRACVRPVPGASGLRGRSSSVSEPPLCPLGRAALIRTSSREKGPLVHHRSLPAAVSCSPASPPLATLAAAAAPARRRAPAPAAGCPDVADRPAVRAVGRHRRLLPRARRRLRGRRARLDAARTARRVVEGNEPFARRPATDQVAAAARRRVGDERADLHRRRAPHDALLRDAAAASSALSVDVALHRSAAASQQRPAHRRAVAAPATGRRPTSCRCVVNELAAERRQRDDRARCASRRAATRPWQIDDVYVDPYRTTLSRGAARPGRTSGGRRRAAIIRPMPGPPFASCARS